jgi:AcrR family transcriptional regulator
VSTGSAGTRHRILDRAWEQLEQEGSGFTIAEVAAAAGVSRQAVYLHFGSRAGLLVATVRHNDTRSGVGDRFEAEIGSATSGVEAIRAWMRVWLDYLPDILAVGRLLDAASTTDPAAHDALRDRMQHQRDNLTRIFQWIHSEGMLSSELDPSEAAEMLWSLVHLTAWDQLVNECGWSSDQFIRSRFMILERAILDPAVTDD